ncbi:T9SS type A sorting domain-containing protein [Flavobacterium sp. DGU11]|uniref:T9SS type A sorting domain-containing protein n=1 Tax=Flavobacterium arundinis TaxID=3139143 RepID=A0ABU9HSP0_9FLAO
MRKEMTALIALLATGFYMPQLYAQQAVTSSGGDAMGSGGTASYSTGQVAYTVITGTGGIATQGVQQPYEIFVLGTDKHEGIKLSAIIYPNPTISTVKLVIDNSDLRDLSFELFDLSGRLITGRKITSGETTIGMDTLQAGTYVLNVYGGAFKLKSFKILKRDL